MSRLAWLRRPAILVALMAGLYPAVVHAGGPTVLTARYVAATAETDPVFGEAAGALVCGTGAGGDCFDLAPYAGAGLFEVTQIIPDNPTDTQTTTSFQGYDVNNDNCVACSSSDPDPAWESNGNGVIGAPIPTVAAFTPLQVFVRALSLHDDGAVRHSITGTIVVTVMDSATFAQQCPPGGTQCGQQFSGAQACPPNTPPDQCQNLPYPYPSSGGGTHP